jgi:hypothetical protein
MTKTAIRSVPTKLPHASIYLDDLFEIEDILSSEYLRLPTPPKISFQYEIDGKLLLTTHEELIEHEGYNSKFTLHVLSEACFSDNIRLMRFYHFLAPEFEAPFGFGGQRWAIFSRVAEIFKARASSLKQIADSAFFKLLFLLLIPGLLYNAMFFYNFIAVSKYSLPVEFLLQLPTVALLMLCIAKLKKNRIYFRFVRQDEKARKAKRNDRIEKLLWLLGGTVIGMMATLGVDQFKHW